MKEDIFDEGGDVLVSGLRAPLILLLIVSHINTEYRM